MRVSGTVVGECAGRRHGLACFDGGRREREGADRRRRIQHGDPNESRCREDSVAEGDRHGQRGARRIAHIGNGLLKRKAPVPYGQPVRVGGGAVAPIDLDRVLVG